MSVESARAQPARLALIFLVGVALSIAQFIMVRDFVTILYGEEVVITLVTASFFVGLSAGYLLSLKLSLRAFRGLLVAALFLHLTFPLSYRLLAVWLSASDAGGVAFLALLFGYALVFNAAFATILPRFIHEGGDADDPPVARMRRYYALELAGFITGFLVVALGWNDPTVYLMAAYWLILAVILQLAIQRMLVTGVYVALAAAHLAYLPMLDYNSTALLYEYKHGISGARTLYSINSPYQKVEVIENSRGQKYLYLDGLMNLNSGGLESLNYYIAQVPAELMKPARTMLMGNGTLSSVAKVYPHSGEVVSVELDGGVLEAGRRHFTPPESLAGFDRWHLEVDDGKHFLRRSDDLFDLIVVDVPSPLTIQEAYLHSAEFYRLASSRLAESGVIAVQLSGPLQKNDRSPARITAALRMVFPQVLVIYSDRADRGFAYASRKLPFSADDVRRHTVGYDRRLTTIEPDDVDDYLVDATPLTMDTMDLVLRRGWDRFTDRYF